MWLKLLGMIFVCSGTTAAGYGRSMEFKKHIEELEKLKQVLWFFRGELSYTKSTLPEICYRLEKKVGSPYDNWFHQLAKQQETRIYQSLGELWEEVTKQCLQQIVLSREELREIQELGYQLGSPDSDMQVQIVEWYIEKVERHKTVLEGQVEEKRRLSQSLGIMSGILLCILLV